MTTPPVILAADIGGTNTRVALLDGTRMRQASLRRYANAKSGSIEAMLSTYLADTDAQPDAVALALAGPVIGDRASMTNLDWHITTHQLSQLCGGAPAVLLNDLQAQGYALPHVDAQHLQTLIPGSPPPARATSLVIGVGTGLNIAAVHDTDGGVFVPPAEAGYINFAPQDAALQRLHGFLAQRFNPVAAEHVVSGPGLELAYLHLTGQAETAQQIIALCAQNEPAARAAVALVIRVLGHFAGDMALVHLPRGGIFLIGGVARALSPYLQEAGFAACFRAKARYGDFLATIPVKMLSDDTAALIGAAAYAQERLF